MTKLFPQALFLAFLVLGLDQASKYYMLENLRLTDGDIVVAPFFNLALVWNNGISFGMFAQHNQPLLLSIMAMAIMLVLLVWLWRNRSKMVAAGIGLVLGGAAGNVIDRFRFGAVVDFLDFHIAGLHWPAFNIADACIFIGVVVLCAHSMFFEEKKSP